MEQVKVKALKSASDLVLLFEAAGFEIQKIEGRYNTHFVIEICKHAENREAESFSLPVL